MSQERDEGYYTVALHMASPIPHGLALYYMDRRWRPGLPKTARFRVDGAVLPAVDGRI